MEFGLVGLGRLLWARQLRCVYLSELGELYGRLEESIHGEESGVGMGLLGSYCDVCTLYSDGLSACLLLEWMRLYYFVVCNLIGDYILAHSMTFLSKAMKDATVWPTGTTGSSLATS